MIFIYAVFSLTAILGLSYFGEFIIRLIYGLEYAAYWQVFVFVFGIVSIQSLSRVVNVQNRMQNKNNVFNHSAIILWLSTIIYGYLYVTDSMINSNIILWIMLGTAFVQLIMYLNVTGDKLNEEK